MQQTASFSFILHPGNAFSEPVLNDLLDNPFVEAVHGSRIYYKKDFYIAMYKLIHDEGKTSAEAYEQLGFKVADLGRTRAEQAGKNAMAKARENTLFTVDPASYDGSVPLSKMGNLSHEEEHAYLLARTIYLEAVIEAQKKIPSVLEESFTSWKRMERT